MTITLPADLQAYLDERVKDGRWPDASAALADAVRALQQQEAAEEPNRAELLALLDEAEAEVAAGKLIRGPINARQMLEEIRQRRGQP
jgi:putative addiction module CopG family antidote